MSLSDTELRNAGARPSIPSRIGLRGRDAALAAAILVGVPNLLFLVLAPWFLLRRLVSPLIYVLAGILALILPWPFAYLVFGLAAAADAFFVLSFLFDMPVATSLKSLRYFAEIDIAASALYLAAGAYFVAVPVVLGLLVNRNRQALRRATLLPTLCLAVLVGWLDYSVNGFRPLSPPPFESAVGQTGIDPEKLIASDRSLLIVLVEGLGAYDDPDERELLAAPLRAAAADRFRFSSGTSRYFGSTTGAESRELCGRWETFGYYLAREEHDCLPGRLRDAGYLTASYHAAYGRLFSRPVWYPRIGFEKLNFRDNIQKERPEAITRMCGTVFTGLCDEDIGNLVHADLVADPGRRKFLYWLTLNSHLPYRPDPARPLDCGTDGARIEGEMACELTEIWQRIFSDVAGIMQDPRTPPVDILVVGDHATPMWSRESFAHFVPGKVDWYYLEDVRPRAVAEAPLAELLRR